MRNLEIIGEAAKRISPELRPQLPALPWRDYPDIDLERVWLVASHDVPVLLEAIQAFLCERDEGPGGNG